MNEAGFWEWAAQNCADVGVELPTPLLAVSNKYPNATQLRRNPLRVWTFRYGERKCGGRNLTGCKCIFKCTWWGDDNAPDKILFQVSHHDSSGWHSDHRCVLSSPPTLLLSTMMPCRRTEQLERGLPPHVREAVMKIIQCGVTRKADILMKLQTMKVRPLLCL